MTLNQIIEQLAYVKGFLPTTDIPLKINGMDYDFKEIEIVNPLAKQDESSCVNLILTITGKEAERLKNKNNTGFFDYANVDILQHDFAEQSQDDSTIEQVLADMRKDFDTFCKQAEEFVSKAKQYDRK